MVNALEIERKCNSSTKMLKNNARTADKRSYHQLSCKGIDKKTKLRQYTFITFLNNTFS